eukprot:scaffold7357_cov195-Pinguiococcus_pyrenoidosus.AAC.4
MHLRDDADVLGALCQNIFHEVESRGGCHQAENGAVHPLPDVLTWILLGDDLGGQDGTVSFVVGKVRPVAGRAAAIVGVFALDHSPASKSQKRFKLIRGVPSES